MGFDQTILKIIARWGLTLMVVALLFILSTMPFDILGLDGVRPAFMLIAVYYMTILRPDLMSYVAVFMMGIALDLHSGSPLGLNAFILVAVQWLTRTQRKFLVGQSFRVIWAGFAVIAFVTGLVQLLIVSIFNMALFSLMPVIISVCLSAALFPLLALPLSYLHKSMADE